MTNVRHSRDDASAWRRCVAAWCAAVVVLAASAPAAAAADPAAVGVRPMRVFRDADGLPQNTVHAIALDDAGRLWLGTQDGAAMYDGRRWTAVDLPDRYRSNFVRALLVTSDGALWFGTQGGGIHRLAGGVWSDLDRLPAVLRQDRINALAEEPGPDGPVLWIATHNHGLLRLAGSEVTAYTTAEGLPDDRVWAVAATTDGAGRTTVWAGTQGGLAVLRAGSARFAVERGFPSISVNSFLATRGPTGSRRLWVGTYGGGVARLDRDGWRHFTGADGLPSEFVTSLARDTFAPGEAVWVGTDGGGLARIAASSVDVFGLTEGLPSNAVYSLLSTTLAQGAQALWVGTRNGGLARLLEGQWLQVRPVPTAPDVPVTAILESADEHGAPVVWMGTDGAGLVRLDGSGTTVIDSSTSPLPSDIVQCLLETSDSRGDRTLWVGTRNGGLARLRDGRWSVFTHASGALPDDMVQVLHRTVSDAGEVVWVGSRGGLSRLQGGRWTRIGTADGLPHASVLSLVESSDRRGGRTLWVGTAGGLAKLVGGAVETVEADALLNSSIQSLRVVSTGGQQVLWVGTDGGGVSRLDLGDGSWSTLTDVSGGAELPNNVVYDVLEDHRGRIYLLTNRGVARLGRGDDGSVESSVFTVDDGLPLNQCVRGAGAVDRRGRIWVGTVGGAAVFDPARETVDRVSKPLILHAHRPRSGGVALRDGAALPFTEDHLVFEFSLLSFFRESGTRYATQLVGLDDTPSRWKTDAKEEFRTLKPGAYVFRVWGRDYAGNVTGPRELSFAIDPPPWRSWWAVMLYALLGAGLVAAGHRVRLVRHRRREQELRELVDARTRELRQANQLLLDLSYLDPLTRVANRRRFDERLGVEWRRASRGATNLALVMVDIDFFKAFNDTYGHQQGDACLQRVASTLADSLPRAGDSVARYGGEEFAVILPATDEAGAVKLAETLRQRVEALEIPNRASSVSRVVTISCGVAVAEPSPPSKASELVRAADDALYRAKQRGRNRTVTARRSTDPDGPPRSSAIW